MKIGIMSMQRIINYGSFLQAYGLRAQLESMGHSVTFVDYEVGAPLAQTLKEPCGSPVMRKLQNAARMLTPAYRNYRKKQILMNKSCLDFSERFAQEFLPQLGVKEARNLRPEVDVLVIGSDEVFNCTQPSDAVGFSLQLFGKDHRAGKLISYAASFGSTTMEKLERYNICGEIRERLMDFDALSVRDTNSREIVSALCGAIPCKHIDPVLLYPFPEAEKIEIPQKNYIVVYAYAGRISEEETKAIRAFARKKNKRILSLGFYQPFCDEYVAATPMEVLACVKHADYVITDTFHGTVFSIKYQVPFAALVRESNRQKLEDLLKSFDLLHRSVTELNRLESVLEVPVDGTHVRALMERYQWEAEQYLRREIDE